MKKNKYTILIACLATLAGCANQEERTEDVPLPIVLSAGVEASVKADVLSRVETPTTFPNGGQIGVIAAEGDNWASYIDIQHAAATTASVGTDANSVYSFTWATAKYWPWPKKETGLKFLAYSPKAASASAVVQDQTINTRLNLTLQATDMPDVLYTDATAEFNREAVDLGLFKHALSKVVVEVKADASMNAAVRVTHLSLTTPNKTASLNLLGADDNSKLTLGAPSELVYPFINNVETSFTTAAPIHKEALVFPGTQGEGCKVSITLKDGVTTLTKEFKITGFTPDSGTITFERAKTSVLTITVKGQKVEAGAIKLQGKLTDWNYQGKYESTIE